MVFQMHVDILLPLQTHDHIWESGPESRLVALCSKWELPSQLEQGTVYASNLK